ncbi:hypothetical protein FEM48_Zijuj12G0161300 [Ziziphus jujuba var. spinosa]|uniref:Retrotransposon gag domain-containing protein n=1 Tax=Ziziphus jujuba var. spinosa TaxID=714518 RepID=A0A978UEB3_ZIZJJ|nr:hypothetical protein FEM48_Zijuj12G0161300 [Ziziphus jujuba var. spinosa]
MDTQGKTNVEFRNEVNEALARHETSIHQVNTQFDQVTATLQTVLSELQSHRVSSKSPPQSREINPFSLGESSKTASESNNHPPKLLFPKFDGEDPQEGLVFQWHRWFVKFRGPVTWKEFTKALLLRFGPTEFEDHSEALAHLRQTSIVAAYQENFKKLSHHIDGLPESFLIGCFIAGLQDNVKIKHPPTLTEAIGVARLIEKHNLLQRKLPQFPRSPVPTTHNQGNPTQGLLGPPPSPKTTPSTLPPSLRRISPQEACERREKGLCYYCDEKFIPGHRCAHLQLFMIVDEAEIIYSDLEVTPTKEPEGITPENSFHEIAGTDHLQTFRVLGRLQNKDLIILIDGGNTHNFIDQAVVTKYGLPIKRSKKFHVMVANKERVECAGLCHALTLHIQGCPIIVDYYVLPVAACLIVLGVQWLATFGPLETDYGRLTMTFK